MIADKSKGRAGIIISMIIFGSIGVMVRNIDLLSGQIALARAALGSLPLLVVVVWRNRSHNSSVRSAIRRNLVWLIVSGAAIGFNWIFLFQAYRFTSIAAATLSYYFAPLFVVILSPIVLKEKLSPFKAFLMVIALAGLFMIVLSESSLFSAAESSANNLTGSRSLYAGVGFGLLAALLYALVILFNKRIKELPGLEMTAIQLVTALLFLLPYVYWNEGFESYSNLAPKSWLLLILLGVFHTGLAYFLYFTSFRFVPGQSIAILSYIDPVFAIIFAAIFLREIPETLQLLGGLLILGSTLLSEIPVRRAV